jgi:hypothetical protein
VIETPTRTNEPATKRQIAERGLTAMQASRLAALSGVEADKLAGRSLAEIAKAHVWQIDPELLLLRKVCGRVVKRDTATGLDHPVPNATVHVYDTEDELWGFFPAAWPWSWLFPVGIREEEIATVTTDACGGFCCWIPAFDVDWVVRWRLERVCLPDFLVRPSIADLLAHLAETGTIHPTPPNPPDPAALLSVAATRGDVRVIIGEHNQQVLERHAEDGAGFGASALPVDRILHTQAFAGRSVPPPLPPHLLSGPGNGHTAALREHPAIPPDKLARIDFRKYLGPFLRCYEHLVPEWYPIIEAPDIAITVTQDIAGSTVTIYNGGFDLPWATWPIPDFTLEASSIAVASPAVECAPGLPCTGVPAVEMIGLMRSTPAYIDAHSGLSVRTEPPKVGGLTGGTPEYPATSPFCGELQFYGCVHVQNAAYYRVQAKYADSSGIPAPAGAAFASIGPVVSHWPVFPPNAPTQTVSCDANGWYPVLPDDVLPSHLLLDWYGLANGVYELVVDVADAGKNVIVSSQPFRFAYDDSAPVAVFTGMSYAVGNPAGPAQSLPLACAQIVRPPGQPVSVSVSAVATSPHLRSVDLGASACSGAGSISVAGTTDWWYQNPGDTSASLSGTFTISADSPPGCYTFSLSAVSRAVSPSGADGSFGADWWNDETAWRPTYVQVTVSIVDQELDLQAWRPPSIQAATAASHAAASCSGPNCDLGMNAAAPHSVARVA